MSRSAGSLALLGAALGLIGCASPEERGEQPPARAASDSPPAPTPSPTPEPVDPWARCPIGATFVQRSLMITRPPLNPFQSEARITIKVEAVHAERVDLSVTTSMPGWPGEPEPQSIPRRPMADGVRGELVEDRSTTITVPAGTFPCRYRRWEVGEGAMRGSVEIWDDPSFPLPYKTHVKGPRESLVTLISHTLGN